MGAYCLSVSVSIFVLSDKRKSTSNHIPRLYSYSSIYLQSSFFIPSLAEQVIEYDYFCMGSLVTPQVRHFLVLSRTFLLFLNISIVITSILFNV